MEHDGEKKYVATTTRILQDQYSTVDCQEQNTADVFQVHINGETKFFTQEKRLLEFDPNYVDGSIQSSNLFMFESKLNLSDILDMTSFHDKSIYSSDTIKTRNRFIFLGEAWETVNNGITGTMFHRLDNDWKKGADNNINFLDIINQSNLLEMVFGDWTQVLQELEYLFYNFMLFIRLLPLFQLCPYIIAVLMININNKYINMHILIIFFHMMAEYISDNWKS